MRKTGCLIWWTGWWIVSGSWVDLGSKRWILAMFMPPALGIVVDRSETTYPFYNIKKGAERFRASALAQEDGHLDFPQASVRMF